MAEATLPMSELPTGIINSVINALLAVTGVLSVPTTKTIVPLLAKAANVTVEDIRMAMLIDQDERTEQFGYAADYDETECWEVARAFSKAFPNRAVVIVFADERKINPVGAAGVNFNYWANCVTLLAWRGGYILLESAATGRMIPAWIETREEDELIFQLIERCEAITA